MASSGEAGAIAAILSVIGNAVGAGISQSANDKIDDKLAEMALDFQRLNGNQPQYGARGFGYIPYSEDFDYSEYKPKYYEKPEDITFELLKRDPKTRQQILDAIAEMKVSSDSNIKSKGDMARELSRMQTQQELGSNLRNIAESMRSTGRGGSGLDSSMRAAAAQEAANRQYAGGLKSATDSQQERLDALKGYLTALSGNESTDLDVQNKYNQDLNRVRTDNLLRRIDTNRRNTDIENNAWDKNFEASRYKNEQNNRARHENYQHAVDQLLQKHGIIRERSALDASNAANWGGVVKSAGNSFASAIGNAGGGSSGYSAPNVGQAGGNSEGSGEGQINLADYELVKKKK